MRLILCIGVILFFFTAQAQKEKVYSNLERAIEHPLQVYHLDLSNKGYKYLPRYPVNILSFERLKSLYLNNNNLFLNDSIYLPDSLRVLHVQNNKMTELPLNIGNLSELRELNVHNNHLLSLPESITELQKLERLIIANNKLTLLYFTNKWKHLKYLDASHNMISGFEKEFCKNAPLEVLILKNNKEMKGFPPIFGNLKKLTLLNADYCGIRYKLPKSMKKLKKLEVLSLKGNKINNNLCIIGSLEALKELDLSSNEISKLSPRISNCSQLEKLDLSDNHLKKLPARFHRLQSLQYLNLKGNNVDNQQKSKIQKMLPNCDIVF